MVFCVEILDQSDVIMSGTPERKRFFSEVVFLEKDEL